ncbi:hypothetical protein ACV4QK_21275 (plasmid) [Alteromonas macleodii]
MMNHKVKLRIYMFVTLMSMSFCGSSGAQVISTSSSQISDDMHKAMVSALKQQKEGLGMRVLSIEDGKHVLSGGNGRYIIKGNLTDLWDGVTQTGTMKEIIPSLPEMVNPSRFFINIGNPEGVKILVFLKSNCSMCDAVFDVLSSPIYRDKYFFEIMLLANDEQSKIAADFVYCSEDQVEALETLLENPLASLKNSTNCNVDTPALTTKAAMAMNIRALPTLHIKSKSLSIIGDPSAHL